ncbi:MAG: cell division protein FtsW [Calditrichaeota bacterium]|nr:cell division protein FtsW [Calditrichota bacterium]
MVRADYRRAPDKVLLIAIAALTVIGIAMVYSASSYKALRAFNDSTHYLKLHVLRVLIGGVILTVGMTVNYRVWLRLSPILLFGSSILLVYVLVGGPGVRTINGSRRWLELPLFRVEVSDLARYAMLFFLAAVLPRVRERLKDFRHGLLPFVGLLGFLAALIKLEPDTSTAVIFFGLGMLMLYLAGARLHHLVVIFLILGTLAVADTLRNPYQRRRIDNFVDAVNGRRVDYHARQAEVGLGIGGLVGVGLGQSKQKLFFLPEPYTDSIFAILGEELGFFGSLVVIGLYVTVLVRGFRIARAAPTEEAQLLALGLTLAFTTYAVLNVAVISSLVPATGIPLPLVSYGGSSLLTNMAALGVLLNISRQTNPSFAPVSRATRVARITGRGWCAGVLRTDEEACPQ